MKHLLEFNDRHPALTTLIGTTSGVASWLFDHMAAITSFASMVGAVGTAILVVLTVAVKFWAGCVRLEAWVRDSKIVAWIHTRRARAWRRRQNARDIPFDDSNDDYLNFGGE